MKLTLTSAVICGVFLKGVDACPAEGDTFTFTGLCTHDRLVEEFLKAFPGCDVERTESLLCPEVIFSDITGKGHQFDKNYFDGGTEWNTEKEEFSPLVADAGRIGRLVDNAASELIAWPYYKALEPVFANGQLRILNLEDDNFCQLDTVMCCFTRDRFQDAPLEENDLTADVCKHDLGTSRHSSHIRDGSAYYGGAEGSNPYCVGFSWDPDENSVSNRFKGNLLFEASFMNTFENGYTTNIPGAPMCGCIEQMPVVSKSDCIDIKVTSDTTSEVDYYEYTFVEGTDRIEHHANVEIVPCEEGFLANFKEKHVNGEDQEMYTEKFKSRIVGKGNCEDEILDSLQHDFYVPGTPFDFDVSEEIWTKVVGKGLLYQSMIGENKFRAMVNNSAHKIIYRRCTSCTTTHQHIFYKRYTPYPEESLFLNLFMNNWFDDHNVLGEDFCLFSTYEDALNDKNCWKFCNYNDAGVGFPRDCGPNGFVDSNWNSYIHSGGSAGNHAFYVEA